VFIRGEILFLESVKTFRPSGVGLGSVVEIELSLSLRFSGNHSGQRLLAA
jgi:hypothetical protein